MIQSYSACKKESFFHDFLERVKLKLESGISFTNLTESEINEAISNNSINKKRRSFNDSSDIKVSPLPLKKTI